MSAITELLPSAHPTVVYRAMPDGGVLFSPASESYFGLNTTAAFVWEHLSPACETLDELCARVQERFPDAGTDRVRVDVQNLLAALAANGLVATA